MQETWFVSYRKMVARMDGFLVAEDWGMLVLGGMCGLQLRRDSNSNSKYNSRSPSGMTTRKTKAKTKTRQKDKGKDKAKDKGNGKGQGTQRTGNEQASVF